MTLRALAATVTLLLSSFLVSQTPQFTDPANLRGERVKPRDGRELPIDQGARGLEQMLRKLNTRASLMLIVAHPDDEDGGMLTYYSRGLGARVAVLTLTRGEGGQNAMTGDFEDALGLLRTQELLSADRYLGVDQFFGTEVDFGFSKTKEEAFKKWTHERVLYDAVRSIRLYRPLVIAAVFIGGVTDGHGQHQVSGQIAQEAFKAAADPTVFPEMIAEGILPWQALKVYARVPSYSISDKGLFDYATGKYTAPRFENYVTGEITTTTPSADVIVHEGTIDPLLSDSPSDPPRTYVQFARIGLGMQKSQIGGGVRVPPCGAFDVAYHLYGSALKSALASTPPEAAASTKPGVAAGFSPRSKTAQQKRALAPATLATSIDFFHGIDTSIEGIGRASFLTTAKESLTELHSLGETIQDATRHFDPKHPEATAPAISKAIHQTDLLMRDIRDGVAGNGLAKTDAMHELLIKNTQLKDALALALGISIEATTNSSEWLASSPISATVQLTKNTPGGIRILEAYCSGGDGAMAIVMSPDKRPEPFQIDKFPVTLGEFTLGSGQVPVSRPYFSRDEIEQPYYNLNRPELRNAPTTPYPMTCGALIATESISPFVVFANARHKEQAVQVVPPLSVTLGSRARVLPSTNRSFLLATDARPLTAGEAFSLRVPAGWHSSPHPQANPPNELTVSTDLITVDKEPKKTVTIPVSVTIPTGQKFTEGYRSIGYGNLPRTNYYTPATVRIVPVDLNLPAKKKIAYLPGTGDAVPEALASLNLKPDVLTMADLTPAKLAQYDTVILGVRTYAAHTDLHGAPTQALIDYARNGGNVLVQYQTTEFTAADAPYPLSLGSNEKVVDETAPVQLLDTKSAFLNTPNKITPADFNDWVEERGHGFLSTWDPHYIALTETHDPDQDPQRGGMITTPLGKGRWTYCAFALYRQLPEAVPGAFRLFVNLLTPATSR